MIILVTWKTPEKLFLYDCLKVHSKVYNGAMKRFTIKDFSEISGLSPHTLRYYEKISLLDAIPRNASGYREYSEDHLRQVEFLQRLRDTGMPIQGMQEYAFLRRQGPATIRQRRELLEKHEYEIKKRLLEQENYLRIIQEKIAFYRNAEQREEVAGQGESPDCRTMKGDDSE